MKLSMRLLVVGLALVFMTSLAIVAVAQERQLDKVEKAELIQPDFAKQKRGECPEGTIFTSEFQNKTWCRSCPEGFTYSPEAKMCYKCPAGFTFIPPYDKAGKTWSLGGLCVTYRD